jgi:ribosome-binding protein aMBF1 (putative translation factor)
MKARTLQDYKTQQMNKPGFKKGRQELDAEFELLESMLSLRKRAGMTQQRLAEKIGTKQPALSRLEQGGFKKTSMETLSKIAGALDARLVVRLEPKH